jgi:protein TonB
VSQSATIAAVRGRDTTLGWVAVVSLGLHVAGFAALAALGASTRGNVARLAVPIDLVAPVPHRTEDPRPVAIPEWTRAPRLVQKPLPAPAPSREPPASPRREDSPPPALLTDALSQAPVAIVPAPVRAAPVGPEATTAPRAPAPVDALLEARIAVPPRMLSSAGDGHASASPPLAARQSFRLPIGSQSVPSATRPGSDAILLDSSIATAPRAPRVPTAGRSAGSPGASASSLATPAKDDRSGAGAIAGTSLNAGASVVAGAATDAGTRAGRGTRADAPSPDTDARGLVSSAGSLLEAGVPGSDATVSSPGRGHAGPAALAPAGRTGEEGSRSFARPVGGYQTTPRYPESARRNGIEGVSLLKFEVLATGRVGAVIVQRSAGHPDLDRSAIEAVKTWRFDPAHRGGQPVAVWVTLPVRFELTRP